VKGRAIILIFLDKHFEQRTTVKEGLLYFSVCFVLSFLMVLYSFWSYPKTIPSKDKVSKCSSALWSKTHRKTFQIKSLSQTARSFKFFFYWKVRWWSIRLVLLFLTMKRVKEKKSSIFPISNWLLRNWWKCRLRLWCTVVQNGKIAWLKNHNKYQMIDCVLP